MMDNWNNLPEAIKNFRTPHSDLIVVKTETDGLYQVYQLCANGDQKFTISAAGRINSNTNVLLAETPHNYNATTDTWEQPTKRTYGVYSYIMGNLSQSAANENSIVYSTVDFYDSKYTTLLRENDEKVNCSVTDYYTFDPNLLISEVKAVLDLDTDAIIAVADTSNTARVKLYIIKDAVNNQIKASIDSSAYYFYFDSAADVREFVIKRDDYSLYSSSASTISKSSSISATKGSLRGLVEFISHDTIGYKDESLLVFPAQELDLTIAEILPESIAVHPATITDFINTTHQLSVEVLPEDAEDKSVSFISDNNEVATVDENGLITLKGEGEATITITSKRVPELSTQVMITAIRPYEKPVINRLSITPGLPTERDQVEFNYDVTYDRSTFKAEEWENKQTRYEAGTHTVRVRVQDSNDLWSDWKELSFNVEAVYQEPTISNLRIDPANPQAGEEVSFIYDKSLDDRLEVKSENWTNKKSSYEAGTHTVKLSITDTADQVSNELSLTFEVAYVPEVPILESISISPEVPVAGESVEFTYVALIDENAEIKEEIWEGKQETYEAGVHEVALTIVDSFNQRSNRLTFSFTVENPPQPDPEPDPDLPPMPSEFPHIYDIVVDPPQPRAGELLSYSYTVGLEAGTSIEKTEWQNKKLIYEEAGVIDVALKVVDSKGQVAMKTVAVEIIEASETPLPPKPVRVKHLEITRWDSASKRFLILEGREK